jgi:hypothetical protein
MSTYSFQDVQASISGPGGNFQLGHGVGVAEEGITIADSGERTTMTIGADGKGMQSLHADNSGKVTVRLQKTSPVNAQLEQMFNTQKQSSASWGQNVITVSDVARGDFIVATEVAFLKRPDLVYAKDANMLEWEFVAVDIDRKLGSGTPTA